jgi:hypothetical protein
MSWHHLYEINKNERSATTDVKKPEALGKIGLR